MRNSMKVAKWEFKKNVKNKSFIISLLITPLMFIIFYSLPNLLDSFESEPEAPTVYIQDDLQIWESMGALVEAQGIEWDTEITSENQESILDEVQNNENTAYIVFDEQALEEGLLTVYTNESMEGEFSQEVNILLQPLQQFRISQLELSDEVAAYIARDISINQTEMSQNTDEGTDPLTRLVPGIFGGVILFSIVMTGMMVFQSASQEKKEKVAEIILSSLKPTELMQGKIIGYFAVGMSQVLVWVIILLPFLLWKSDFPIAEYLFVPETLFFVFISILGYLLFAAIFAGIGATFEDVDTTSNFQGFVFMLPFVPLLFIGPVLSDPSGIIAQIGTYFPLSSPGVLLMRLSMLDSWPWVEIGISLAILIASIWICMKLAGKIFSIGILIYGKNASLKEMVKWLKY
ncbi:ABC transporter permease [Cytobacillus gottheilii]|uniref:ABC transporter permease n=1 Tax=Cytobacillus gottheilii TaxID=859144 RepID=A0ABX8FCF0_9BACI|nr:ABC transporter permease [Cytobacillus gottheilii]QVY61909.1 ABC transporter permease [Cytobacillus gottheilii]